MQGINVDHCIFDSYLDFEAGGHNKKPVIITNTEFKDFVNFFDCWYQDEVIVCGNDFRKGTNLCGNKGKSYQTQFDMPPLIKELSLFRQEIENADRKLKSLFIPGFERPKTTDWWEAGILKEGAPDYVESVMAMYGVGNRRLRARANNL